MSKYKHTKQIEELRKKFPYRTTKYLEQFLDEQLEKKEEDLFVKEQYNTQEEVRGHIQNCEGRHPQQVAYSTFHDALTQICYGCRRIRTNIKA